MLWYGFLYYIFFIVLFYFFISFYLRLFYLNSFIKTNVFVTLIKMTLNFFIFFIFFSFLVLYQLFDLFSAFIFCKTQDFALIFDNDGSSFFFIRHGFLGLNLMQVYYFPFIYIFLFVTMLSILFCLSYSTNEFTSFIFYCVVILIAGYSLFFTDSVILFFVSYELLLIPSFFILYKFAKTRRCIEAAYLMFF
jgi:hypothetical protein